MASRPNSSSHQRPSSATTSSRGKGRSSSVAKNSRPPSGKSTSSILSKEEEYMRLNAELEAKTASLIKEAEGVLQDQDQLLSRPLHRENEYEADISESITDSSVPAIKEGNKKSVRPSSAKVDRKHPLSKTRNRPKSAHSKQPSGKEQSSIEEIMKRENLLEDRIQFANTISVLEDESEDTQYRSSVTDDVLPETAEDLSSEAVVRFLKAKLRVMQEELDRISTESISKDEKVTVGEHKIKELKEEQQRIQKTNQSLQAQSDKYKKLYEESKRKCDGVESQLVTLRKELDSVQRDQKQTVVTKNAIEVRLNRALEEVDKYKSTMQKQKTSSKDASEQEKRRTEQLVAENKRLEKQKSELMTAFKKQMKLIDVLKRQKGSCIGPLCPWVDRKHNSQCGNNMERGRTKYRNNQYPIRGTP